ncbi:MAG: DUF1800 family protein, partial [Acidimicrobiales bacterium]|nr:DUF1800 family protein [Acidimicrobiales bacterium]
DTGGHAADAADDVAPTVDSARGAVTRRTVLAYGAVAAAGTTALSGTMVGRGTSAPTAGSHASPAVHRVASAPATTATGAVQADPTSAGAATLPDDWNLDLGGSTEPAPTRASSGPVLDFDPDVELAGVESDGGRIGAAAEATPIDAPGATTVGPDGRPIIDSSSSFGEAVAPVRLPASSAGIIEVPAGDVEDYPEPESPAEAIEGQAVVPFSDPDPNSGKTDVPDYVQGRQVLPTATSPATVVEPAGPNEFLNTIELIAARASFGATPQLLTTIESMGIEAWVDQQLNPTSIDDSESEGRFSGYNLMTTGTYPQVWDNEEQAAGQLYWATVARAVSSKRQLQEVMVQFWREHFSMISGELGHYVFHDRFIRQHALGRFQDLLVASGQNAGILEYLNNNTSDADAPGGVNENYGRELLELHSLGIVNNQQDYTELDVQAAARVMSGFSTRWREGYTYKQWLHYDGPISAFGGAWSTPGRSGPGGEADGLSFLRYLAKHPSTARHIAYKLVAYFVNENPPPDLVESARQIFVATKTEIAPTVRHILLSPQFAASRGVKVKRGFEWAMSLFRSTKATIQLGGEWHGWDDETMAGVLERAGQQLYGWALPDGYPVANAHWASTNFLFNRWDMTTWISQQTSGAIRVDAASLLPTASVDADKYIRFAARNLVGRQITQAEVDAALGYLGVAPTANLSRSSIPNPAEFVAVLLMGPTFQLRG